jgi:hypothetical protein
MLAAKFPPIVTLKNVRANKELRRQFVNISKEAIRIFGSNCEQCIIKRTRSEISKLVVKPILSADFNCRGQVDLV